jgi:hypothetical protein
MDRSICQGSPADLTQLVNTLSSAFQYDPAFSWIHPDPVQRRLRLPKLFDIVVRSDLAAGSVLRSESYEAVTLWRAPGKAHVGLMEILMAGLGYFQTFGAALSRGLAVSHAMESHHPKGIDYWYLHPANSQTSVGYYFLVNHRNKTFILYDENCRSVIGHGISAGFFCGR